MPSPHARARPGLSRPHRAREQGQAGLQHCPASLPIPQRTLVSAAGWPWVPPDRMDPGEAAPAPDSQRTVWKAQRGCFSKLSPSFNTRSLGSKSDGTAPFIAAPHTAPQTMASPGGCRRRRRTSLALPVHAHTPLTGAGHAPLPAGVGPAHPGCHRPRPAEPRLLMARHEQRGFGLGGEGAPL